MHLELNLSSLNTTGYPENVRKISPHSFRIATDAHGSLERSYLVEDRYRHTRHLTHNRRISPDRRNLLTRDDEEDELWRLNNCAERRPSE